MRSILITFLLIWLLSLSSYATGAKPKIADSQVAHVFERIWLWEMYDFICDIETPEKKTKDKRLTYAEFQKRLQGGNPHDGALPTIDSPADGDPFKSAKQLLDLRWHSEFAPHEVDPSLPKPKEPDVEGLNTKNYLALVGKTEEEYSQFRIGLVNNPFGNVDDPARIQRIATTTKAIQTFRYQSRVRYVTNSVTSTDEGGLGLAKVKTNKHPTALTYKGTPLGLAIYEKTNYVETYKANCIGEDEKRPGPRLKALGVKRKSDFTEIMKDFGRDYDKHSSRSDKNHLLVLKRWTQVSDKAHSTAEKLKQCQ